MMAPLFLNSFQVAAQLGLPDGPAFLRQRARLERDHAFPQPMPTFAFRCLRWRADQVAYWVETQGLPRANRPALPSGGNVVLLQRAATV